MFSVERLCMAKLSFLVFSLYTSLTTSWRSFLIVRQSSAPNIEREDSLVKGLDYSSLLNLARTISGLNGYIPTILHEDMIFLLDKAFVQARKKRQKKSRLVI
jgi:hypothetical protein